MASFDITTCKWVLWGAKRPYNTFGHIHEAFLKALRFMGRQAWWLDNGDEMPPVELDNTLFMSLNTVLGGMPQRKDCFYVIHNILGDPAISYVNGLRMLPYGIHISTNKYSNRVVEVQPDCYFEPGTPSLSMRWGTDLLPYEIQANKPVRAFNENSTVCNFVGSIDSTKKRALEDFGLACRMNGRELRTYGGFNGPVVSDELHQCLIKDSYMAPAFEEDGQNDTGYVSCRLFKNISYGQMGITQSAYAQELFKGRLILGSKDSFQLFHEARNHLRQMPVKDLHWLMDEVAEKYTYLNKVRAIIRSVREVL